MVNRTSNLAVSLVYAVAIGSLLVHSQATVQLTDQLAELVNRLEDSAPSNRNEAFYHLLEIGLGVDPHGHTYQIPSALTNLFKQNPSKAENIKIALIRLLENENAFVQGQRKEYDETGKTLDEVYVDYYGDVIASVAALKDERALNALLGAINTGNMATRALAGLGTSALDQILLRLSDPAPVARMSAARVLVQMLEPGNVKRVGDAVSKKRIKTALTKTTGDIDPYVRITGVEGLAALGDRTVVPLLQKVAEYDSFEGFGEGRRFPVREAAKKALEKLR